MSAKLTMVPLFIIGIAASYKEIAIIGQSYSFEPNRPGVQLDVSEEALAKIEEGEYSVFRTERKEKCLYSGSVLKIENITMTLAHNQKAVRCIDLRRCDRVEMKNVRVRGKTKNTYLGVTDLAKKGCIGITMTDGSNNFIVRYDNVSAGDFYEGIQVGGEHVIMIIIRELFAEELNIRFSRIGITLMRQILNFSKTGRELASKQ